MSIARYRIERLIETNGIKRRIDLSSLSLLDTLQRVFGGRMCFNRIIERSSGIVHAADQRVPLVVGVINRTAREADLLAVVNFLDTVMSRSSA